MVWKICCFLLTRQELGCSGYAAVSTGERSKYTKNEVPCSCFKPCTLLYPTDNLYNNQEGADSSEGSTFSPVQPQSPAVVRRLNSQVRSRMCRSLGADLDQILQEEARGGVEGGSEAARLNRLHLISSSLSLHYNLSSSSLSSCSTPPRCHSLADLVEGVEGKGLRRSLPAASSSSTAPHEGPSRQVRPLDSLVCF